MNLKKRFLLASLSALAMSASAYAADDHKGHAHDKKGATHAPDEAKPLYGGIVTQVKDINYELVVKPDAIALYVHDHGKPVDMKKAAATVTLLSSSDKVEAKLTPAGENKLEAKGAYKTAPGTKAIASVTMPGKSATNVRFTLK